MNLYKIQLSFHTTHSNFKTPAMTSILKRVLSIRDVREAAAAIKHEGDATPLVMQEAEAEGMAPVPNFAEVGITDHTAILEE